MRTYVLAINILLHFIASRENEAVISLYQRPTLHINPEANTVDLYLGLTKDDLETAQQLPFVIDFNYSHILVNENINCDDLGYCEQDGDATQTDSFNGKDYSYKSILTLAATQIISPAEIDEIVAEAVSKSRIRMLQNKPEGIPNVLGLSPLSDVWNYWNEQYYIRYEKLNITYHRYPNNEFMVFNSKITKDDVLVIAPIEEKLMFTTELAGDGFILSVNNCVKMDKEVFFELNDNLYDTIRTLICKIGTPCQNQNDLRSPISESISFNLIDSNSNKTKNFVIKIKDLYKLDKKTGVLTLHFDRNTDAAFSTCDIILQNKFFEKYYLLISYLVVDDKELRVGFGKIGDGDFYIKNLWKWVLIPSCILLAIGSVLYYYKNIKKRQDVNADYQNLPTNPQQKHKND